MKTLSEAIKKAMDYLAMRDHSRSELRMKLTKHDFTPDDIDEALNHVESSGWLLPPQALAEKVADQLHHKNKSHDYIVKYLQQKELPPVPRDSSQEYEKARSLLGERVSPLSKPSTLDKKQIISYLQFRGFDHETIQRVINENEPSGNSPNV